MSEEFWSRDGGGFTMAELKAEVYRLGEEFPDRQVACSYTHNGEPVCIVGQAIFNLTGKLVNPEDNRTSFRVMIGSGNLSAEETRDFHTVCRIQRYQDEDCTWGVAVARAKQVV